MFDLGQLRIITPGFVTAVGALSAVAVLAGCRLRRRRMLAVACAVVALLITPLTAAAAVNAHYRYLPRVDDALGIATWPRAPLSRVLDAAATEPFPKGVVVEEPITGWVSGFGTRVAYVYLPPQYFTEPAARFPTAYLLHGSPGAPLDWLRAGNAATAGYAIARTGHPVILVAPRLSRSWLDDSECLDRPDEHVETYLTRDVVSAVDRTFRTLPDASDRLLVGISAGGYCALNIGLLHRSEFGALADLSGLDRPTHSGGLRGLLGPDGTPAELAAQTPADYVGQLPVRPRERIYLAAGRSDHGPLHDETVMAAALRARSQDVTFTTPPGTHDYTFWRRELPLALAWWTGAPAV